MSNSLKEDLKVRVCSLMLKICSKNYSPSSHFVCFNDTTLVILNNLYFDSVYS